MTIAQVKAFRRKFDNDPRWKGKAVSKETAYSKVLRLQRSALKAAKARRSFGYKKK